MLIFCVCLFHAWVLHAVSAQTAQSDTTSEARLKFAASLTESGREAVPLYPAHKAAALRAAADPSSTAKRSLPAGASTDQGAYDVRRCRSARCVPDEKQLRAYVRPDLKRPPALPNDKAIHLAGLDKAIHDLETLMIRTMTRDLETLKDTRAGSIFTFREHVDYDARVATSPGIQTICEVGFYCGQSAVIFLEANPQVRIIGFDDFSYAAGEACYHHLQHRYPGRINVYRGDSRETIPAFIEEHWANGVYNGPVCDLIRTDARPEYPLRRQDFSLLQPMTSCSTLILFNDVCDIQNCHLYQVKNCYWQYGNCTAQNPLFFEGSAMVYEELIRRKIVDPLDEFFLGQTEPNFYKSWALGRMACGSTGKPRPLPTMPLFPNPEVTELAMRTCFKQGGCAQKIT